MLLLAMFARLMLSGQEAGSPTESPTTLPTVEVVAPVNDGVVTLECRVIRDGRLSDCVILSETPAGQGFGQAALEAARRARVSRETFGRATSGAKVRFTTRFRLDDSGPPLT